MLVCVCVLNGNFFLLLGVFAKIEASRRAGRRCFLNDRLEFRVLRSLGGTSKRSRRSVFIDLTIVSGQSRIFLRDRLEF